MTLDERSLQTIVDKAMAESDVPGVSVGVLHGDEVTTAVAGVLNLSTGHEVQRESLFQIGSITKPWTATLVQILVDRDLVDLDTPVVTWLPELELADASVRDRVTLRHLLTHTSGIAGDVFDDVGRGDDVLERYVACLAGRDHIHPLGATMSYCNAGFGIAGRVLETVLGAAWDQILRDELLTPLGLERTCTLPEEALRHGVACGHVGEAGQVEVTPTWSIPRSAGPAGLIMSTAAELLEFARLHLQDGVARDGTAILTPGSSASMRQPLVEIPNAYVVGEKVGLSWLLSTWDGAEVFGHDGTTLGQKALLRIVPEHDLAITILANGEAVDDLRASILDGVLAETAELARPAPPKAAPDADPSWAIARAGTYETAFARLEIEATDDGRLVVQPFNLTPLADNRPPMPSTTLEAADEFTWVPAEGQTGPPATVFYALADGTPYVHQGARAIPRA